MSQSSSFTFLSNPNPNPDPGPHSSFVNSFYSHHPPSSSSTTTASISTGHDIPALLSTLSDLIQLSETTIGSIATLFSAATIDSSPNSSSLCTCPFNPNHRIPPPSFFHHYLQCPSSSAIIDLTLIEYLQYPRTLQPMRSLIDNETTGFVQNLPKNGSDLCFSLEDYPSSLGSNYFYVDCPAVVSFDCQDSSDLMLTLPAVLLVECTNFHGKGNTMDAINGLSPNLFHLLPSELWIIRNEIKVWNDFPAFYSYSILRAILVSYMHKSCNLMEWLLVNSVAYGVVIDAFMGDHICLLLRLCLKAIAREAVTSLLCLFSGGDQKGWCKEFNCPTLVRVFMWFTSQLSVLYGDDNGKLFAIEIIKRCLVNASSCLLLSIDEKKFSVTSGLGKVDGETEEMPKESREKEENIEDLIFVSQVAAAVAALHERYFLERKIRAVRYPLLLNNHVRVREHESLSLKADKERQKRQDYRPVLGHDVLLMQQTSSQETKKMKTREELLAEQRDYKRRRMSYRGKKMSRSATQVTRDIIDEFMEEIKQAGGIGHSVEVAKDVGVGASESVTMHQTSMYKGTRFTVPYSYEEDKETSKDFRKRSASNHSETKCFEDDLHRDNKQGRRNYDRGHGYDELSSYRNRHDKGYYSADADGRKKEGQARDRRRDEVNETAQLRESNRTGTYKTQGSARNEFEDRYDPSKSVDLHEDDLG